jgi:hypothetical protein
LDEGGKLEGSLGVEKPTMLVKRMVDVMEDFFHSWKLFCAIKCLTIALKI